MTPEKLRERRRQRAYEEEKRTNEVKYRVIFDYIGSGISSEKQAQEYREEMRRLCEKYSILTPD